MSEAPPVKPWEINRVQNSASIGPLHSNLNPAVPDPSTTIQSYQDAARKSTPPPVPPRPSQRSVTPMGYQSSYGTGYGGYGSLGYGSGYGSYGGYGSMYGGYGGGYYGSYGNRPFTAPGGFARQAEENTRTAFQSVESIVRAFTSVSAMLESTLGAVYSSFRAVLDVADQFSRVRATFSDILSSIAIFRFVRYLYRRAKSMLRLGGAHDEAWDTVTKESPAAPKSRKAKSWPMLLFMSVVIGGPYLIWKLLSGSSVQKQSTTWANGQTEHVVAKVEHSFEGENDDELTVKAGDSLNLAPKEQQPHIRDWVLASLDGVNVGMVPKNHVKILGLRRGRQPDLAVPPPNTNPAAPNTNVQDANTLEATNPASV